MFLPEMSEGWAAHLPHDTESILSFFLELSLSLILSTPAAATAEEGFQPVLDGCNAEGMSSIPPQPRTHPGVLLKTSRKHLTPYLNNKTKVPVFFQSLVLLAHFSHGTRPVLAGRHDWICIRLKMMEIGRAHV